MKKPFIQYAVCYIAPLLPAFAVRALIDLNVLCEETPYKAYAFIAMLILFIPVGFAMWKISSKMDAIYR